MKFKVVYSENVIDEDFDKFITKTLEKAGCKWTGQGTDLTTMERDIGFECGTEYLEKAC